MDDPSNENIGWNFLKDGRVSWPVDGRHWLQDHIEADDERQGQFVSTRFVSTAVVAPRRQTRETTRRGATVRLRPKGTGTKDRDANRWAAKQAESTPRVAGNAPQPINEAGVARYM